MGEWVHPRDFLPGKCNVEGVAPVPFVESDQRGQANQAAIAVCKTCVQLPHCQTSRDKIGKVLQVRGIKAPVVGGEVVRPNDDLKYLIERERLLYEPAFSFDLEQDLPLN